jgi:putative nucleotidyltransferase with HDIG domain
MQDIEHRERDGDRLSGSPDEAAGLLIDTRSILSSLDLGSLLERLGEALSALVKIDGLSMKLAGLTEELLLLRENGSFRQEMIYGSRLLTRGGLGDMLASDGSPLVIASIADSDLNLPSYVAREGFTSLVAVPLMSGARRIGVVTIYLRNGVSVSPSVTAMISIVGSVTATAVENFQLVRRIEKNYFSTVEALAAAIEVKDPYTLGHSKRVTQFAIALAERLGISGVDMKNLQYGATLHDIGKIGIPGEILNKQERLTRAEYAEIKQHPVIGERIIERVDFLQGARPVVRGHHERFNGSGYPDGLAEEEIPFLARIVGLVDFYDALTSDRPYREAYTPRQALEIAREGIGREFDPAVAREFLDMSAAVAPIERLEPAGVIS